jgi:ABC-type dipeptide/oligopeptide/nickel transport system ATPase component
LWRKEKEIISLVGESDCGKSVIKSQCKGEGYLQVKHGVASIVLLLLKP